MIDLDTFSSDIQSSVELLRTAIPLASDQLRLLPGVYNVMLAYSDPLASTIRQCLLSSMTRTIASTEFQSKTEATAALETLIPLFDTEIALTDNLTVFEALRSLKSALVNDVTTRGLLLPDLVTVTYKQPLPAVVIAHDLYLDATRADEITVRNDPVHPLFCQTNLEVLAR